MSPLVIKNTSWLFFEKIIRMSLSLFVGIYVARYLGPEEFGQLSYAISLYTILFSFSNFGIDGVVVKKLVEERDEYNKGMLIFTSMIIKLSLSFLSIIIVAAYITITSFDDNSYTLLILSFSLSFLFLNVFDLYFQSIQKNKYVAISNILMLILTNLCKVMFVVYELRVEYFAGVYILETLLFGLAIYSFFKRETTNKYKLSFSFSFEMTKSILSQSWPLFFSSLSFVLYNSANTIMLNRELSSLDVGIYNAASRFVNVWHFLPGIFLTSLFPLLIQKKNSNNKIEFESFISKTFSAFIWFPLLIGVFIYFTSDLIIDFTYGREFEMASYVLSILIFSNVTIFITSFWNKWMLVEGNTKVTFVFQLLKVLFLITLNLILIPMLGLSAVLISTVLSGVIVQLFIPMFMKNQRNYIVLLFRGFIFKW